MYAKLTQREGLLRHIFHMLHLERDKIFLYTVDNINLLDNSFVGFLVVVIHRLL